MTTADTFIFPEYIFPNIKGYLSDPEPLVRTTLACCISYLAETSARFLDLSLVINPDNNVVFDSALLDLRLIVKEFIEPLLIDQNTFVKRSLLSEIPRLAQFLGKQLTNDLILSHMITYLNDSDWQLRRSFLDSVVGVANFVGSQSVEMFLLPILRQAIAGISVSNV